MDYQDSIASFSHKTYQEVKQLSIKLQGKKGDCLPKGFVSELPNAIYLKILEVKKLQELKIN